MRLLPAQGLRAFWREGETGFLPENMPPARVRRHPRRRGQFTAHCLGNYTRKKSQGRRNAMTMGALIAKLAAVSAVMLSGIANAAEIKVIGSPGTREPYTLLVPGFEKATGHKVTTTWGGVTAVAKRVADGEVADVVMLPAAQIDDLIKQGKLVADSRVNVASSGIGVAIRAGAPTLDASSSARIRKALIAAKTIAYSAGPSGIHIERLIAKWGLTDQLKAKIMPPIPDVPIGEVVARGDAEIG